MYSDFVTNLQRCLSQKVIVFLDDNHTRYVHGRVISIKPDLPKGIVYMRILVETSKGAISAHTGSTYSCKVYSADTNNPTLNVNPHISIL